MRQSDGAEHDGQDLVALVGDHTSTSVPPLFFPFYSTPILSCFRSKILADWYDQDATE